MTQKTMGKISQATPIIAVPKVAPTATTQTEGSLGTKFTVFAMSFNIVGLAAVTFGNTAFGGNIVAADLVLGSSLACLTANLIYSIKGRFGRKPL